MTINRFAVVGRPISHSLSPALFEPGLRDQSPDSYYIRVTGMRFPAICSFADRIDLDFANVTHPFKEDAAGLTDNRQMDVQRIGAANGVRWLNGDTEVWNTDPDGVRRALLTHWTSLEGKSLLVIGIGGAGRAAVDGLLAAGARVYVWNRTSGRVRETCIRYPDVMAVDSENLNPLVSRMDGIVWCIPGYPDILHKFHFNPNQVVLDANYGRNMQTAQPFAPALRIDGVQWLAGQAAESMHRLGLHVPSLAELIRRAKASPSLTSDSKALALIGFMGSGKTTIGRLLAEEMDREFVDLDSHIEKADGRTIPEIFQQSGEDVFRRLEADTLRKLDCSRNPILATGGGVPSNPDAAQWLAENAVCIWLYRPLDLLKEIAQDPREKIRPLLQAETMEHIFNQRILHYAKRSDLVVVQDKADTPGDITALLLKEPLVMNWKKHRPR